MKMNGNGCCCSVRSCLDGLRYATTGSERKELETFLAGSVLEQEPLQPGQPQPMEVAEIHNIKIQVGAFDHDPGHGNLQSFIAFSKLRGIYVKSITE